MKTEALFDPGFAPLVYSFTDNITAINQVMRSVKNPNQRKFKFQMIQPQILTILENNIAFYLGCLMWARYVKDELPNQKIVGNSFLGIDAESINLTEEIFCSEVNLIIEYFEKYKKDCKFYLGKEFSLNAKWLKIAKIYKEFLLLNKSFVNTELTTDLLLPENLSEVVIFDNSTNKELITKAIEQKKLSILLDS